MTSRSGWSTEEDDAIRQLVARAGMCFCCVGTSRAAGCHMVGCINAGENISWSAVASAVNEATHGARSGKQVGCNSS
jgi:hypothetical protein